jgi:hypothetical protein
MLEGHDIARGFSRCSGFCHFLCCRSAGGFMAVVGASPDPAGQADTADRVRAILSSLVRERQTLRHARTDRAALEANRLAIVYWQQELSKRLIENGVR